MLKVQSARRRKIGRLRKYHYSNVGGCVARAGVQDIGFKSRTIGEVSHVWRRFGGLPGHRTVPSVVSVVDI